MPLSPFERGIQVVLEHEGGYVNNPADPGGATNWGISLRFLKGVTGDFDFDHDGDVDADDMRLMSREKAIEIYRTSFWDRYGYGRLTVPEIAIKVFDTSVNMGREAHKILQRSVNNVSGKPVLKEDGVLGPMTVAGANACEPTALLGWLREDQWLVYQHLIHMNPKLATFAAGWKRRAYS